MSLPRPIRPYHFQADLIWWDGPFKERWAGAEARSASFLPIWNSTNTGKPILFLSMYL